MCPVTDHTLAQFNCAQYVCPHEHSLHDLAVASGNGRDGRIDLAGRAARRRRRCRAELGGQGGATNPEQLFAAGYAACFHSALKLVAGADDADTSDSEVVADVSLGCSTAGRSDWR